MAEEGKKLTKKERDKDARRLIGDQIRICRNARSMTQEDLAEKVGRNLSVNSLSRYETGETEIGIVTFLALADALNIEPNDLVPTELIPNSKAFTISEEYEKLSNDRKYIIHQIINSLLCQQEGQK